MESFSDELKRFLEIEKNGIEKAKRKEKIRFNINPESYIGREIRYQTTILKKIEEQNDEIIRALKRGGTPS